jgi:hypothetical protein
MLTDFQRFRFGGVFPTPGLEGKAILSKDEAICLPFVSVRRRERARRPAVRGGAVLRE